MPFIPHTEKDKETMLATVGVSQLGDLFAEIPSHLQVKSLPGMADGVGEMEMTRIMNDKAKNMQVGKCFIGAGAYEHHIPGAVWDITLRGEFLTAYTPYQAEASQGTLQLVWEYQTMMSSLMGLGVSNASLYDGATALAEAVLMAYRLKRRKNHRLKVWIPQTIHPFYRQTLLSLLNPQGIEIFEIPYDEKKGILTVEILNQVFSHQSECGILVIPQPNFFGRVEEVNALTDWGHSKGAIVIGCVNPLAMALLKPPGQWGQKGVDIACGEGQPLGVGLASGGPYFGFLCSRMEYVHQIPGRLVGRTVDKEGKPGFTLTLQAREQHIRRGKATSNICTNQGLLVTAAAIYMSLLGPKGLKLVAKSCYERTQFFIKQLESIGVQRLFLGSHFHEIVLALPIAAEEILDKMQRKDIAAGFALGSVYPHLKNALLVCTTETKTDKDILEYVSALKQILYSDREI